MAKKYASVAGMATALIDDKAFTDDFARHVSRRRVVKKLAAIRAARGLTQAEVAEQLDCTQGKISKLESSEDEALNFGDVIRYSDTLGVRLELTFVGSAEVGPGDPGPFRSRQRG